MTIRKAEDRDIPAMREIYNYEVLNGTATFDTIVKDMADRRAWFEAHGDGYPLLVAEEDGVLAGYASLSPYGVRPGYRPCVELSVYIHRDYRRRGYAEALMKELLALAKADERVWLVVSVITGGNAASVRLHERLGFVPAGILHQAGYKLGKRLDVYLYEYPVGPHA